MPISVNDVVTIGGGALLASAILGRDCAFPITRFNKYMGKDQVLQNMPVFIGWWEDDTVVPVILDQNIDVDTTTAVTECDVSIVSASLTEGSLIAPNQKKIKLSTPTLLIDQLIPKFCMQRNISRKELGLIMDSGGSLDTGNPYAIDFGRFALASVSKALFQILSQRIMRGDESMQFGFDGLYTQLENGWAQGATGVPDEFNKAVVIDWAALTGVVSGAQPDDVTLAGKTITLWGETFNVPEGVNLIQLFEDYLFPSIETTWTDNEGGVDVWELHVPTGTKRCYINASACMQPCGGASGIWDTELRTRFAELRRRDVVQFYPSMREVPVWESPSVEPNSIWIGPRLIGGNPTYAAFFRDMNEMFASAGILGNTYGQGSGAFPDAEPLLVDLRDTIPFEANTIHYDVEKTSMDCVSAGLMTKVGFLAVARHLWIKVTGITCGNMIARVQSGVTIDGEPLEGTPHLALLTTPAANATGQSTTPTLTATVIAGATSYDFEVATDINMTALVKNVNQVSNVYTVVGALAATTAYYWRARGRNAEGAGSWSAVRKFTTT